MRVSCALICVIYMRENKYACFMCVDMCHSGVNTRKNVSRAFICVTCRREDKYAMFLYVSFASIIIYRNVNYGCEVAGIILSDDLL